MVTECIQTETKNELNQFLQEKSFNCLELRLLLFWGRHPHTKLSLYTIASAIDGARVNLREAIASLVKKNILVEQHYCSDLTTYRLGDDPNLLECLEELVRLDWHHVQELEQQLESAALLNR
jgi:hypothetical protein